MAAVLLVALALLTALVASASEMARPWLVMWLLAAAIFVGCKGVSYSTRLAEGTLARRLGYWFLWPGLDANAFFATRAAPGQRPALGEWWFAVVKLALGLLLFGLAPRLGSGHALVIGWIGMTGIVLVLHFGAFHLLSCGWRSMGVDARPLMHWPILSRSVSEFWGRRWNTAFRDFAHRFVFRPLVARLGPRGGLAAGFLFSGVAHDAVISLPASGGYGLPTLYFLLQGAALLLERSRLGRAIGLGSGWRGRAFAALVVIGPAPLLFHPWFIERIVLPFLRVLGAVA